MPEVRFLIHSRVEDADAFRDLAGRMTAFVRENEPGTKTYNWFENADGTWINEDRYQDSAALLTHLGNAGEQGFLDDFVSLAAIESVQVLGAVDDEAREALAGFGAVHYDVNQGL